MFAMHRQCIIIKHELIYNGEVTTSAELALLTLINPYVYILIGGRNS